MAYNLPAIIHRLESNLVALDACKMLGLEIQPDLALEALTKDSDNSDEHGQEKINFQAGMGKNYERLEFLGDSFLKMSTTIALYSHIPASSEFEYHVERMVLICNKNLFNNALELKLEEYVRSKAFNRRDWYPRGLEQLWGKRIDSNKGKKGSGKLVHVLADKTIADVCEALIGAAYLTTYEEKNMDTAVRAVTTFTHHKKHKMINWKDFYEAYQVPDWQTAEATAAQRHLANQIEDTMGYKFTHPRLLRCAFTHPSYPTSYERIPSYQRLEFLGDALLDIVCVDYLYHHFPDADPQWLTEHKMAMVSNQFLGCLCVSLNLHKHLVFMAGRLGTQISDYIQVVHGALEEAKLEAGERGLGHDQYSRDYWVQIEYTPKCLPDIVEAYIGALFVDSKYDLDQVWRFFNTYIRPYFEDMALYDTFANKHPVTFLSQTMQNRFNCSDWRMMVEEMPVEGGSVSAVQVVSGVLVHGQVIMHATAASGRYAKIAAAKRTLDMLSMMQVRDFKTKFGCTCVVGKDGAEEGPLAHATAI